MGSSATITDATNGRSSLVGRIDYQGRAEFNIRGNSSRAHPKKAYRLELQTETGEDLKVPLLGMPAESDWILFPAFTDKTMVRDALAYELWRAMGHYGPRTRYVELFVHQGRRTNAEEELKRIKGPPSPNPLPQEREERRRHRGVVHFQPASARCLGNGR